MKITRVEEKQEIVKKVHHEATECDLCKRRFPSSGWGLADFEGHSYKETEVVLELGYNWPEGGNYMKYSVDICPGCFKEKLIPWLELQGATIQEEEIDW